MSKNLHFDFAPDVRPVSEEEWRALPGFEDRYHVSSHGRIRGRKGELLKIKLYKGRRRVDLCRHSKRYGFNVHRLVALAFLGPVPPGKEVNHIDGNKLNDAAWNLEYVTHLENCRHAQRMGLIGDCGGPYAAKASFTVEEVLAIRERYRKGERVHVIWKSLNRPKSTISAICQRTTWKRV
jgi:hypothetical protein